MGLMDDRATQEAERAKQKVLDDKRHTFRTIAKSFSDEMEALERTLRVIEGISERVSDDGSVSFSLIVNRLALKVRSKDETQERWELYRQSIDGISTKLREGAERWKLWPLRFTVTDKTTGKPTVDWHLDAGGAWHKDN